MNLEHLQRRLGYHFNDVGILNQALTHRSMGIHNNERLEFLGDAILGFEVAEALFLKHDAAQEGQLSRMRSHLVKRETLAEIARDLQLGEFLFLGPGELRSGGQNRDSILADAIEAIIAGVYLDGGMVAARMLIRRLLGERIEESSPEIHSKDPKTRLQEYQQARGEPLPVYEIKEISGDQHAQRFHVVCRIDSLALTMEGEGSSRRKAEQQAADRLLKQLSKAS